MKSLKNKTFISRLLFLMLIIVTFTIIAPRGSFLSVNNFSNVILQQVPLTLLMSLGMTLAIITGGIDKSMGSVLVLSTVLSSRFIKNDNLAVGIFIALAVGLACGLLNGILITRVGVFPFIATYGVENVALGIALIYTGGKYIYDFPVRFRNIFNGNVLGMPSIALIALIVFAALYLLESSSVFGRKIHNAGYNLNATILSGIDGKSVVTIVYMINGLLASLTGILYMARLNAADPNISAQFTLDSIAATLIGGTSFGGGKGSVLNTIVGTMIVVFIQNGMNVLKVPATWSQTVIGGIIFLSVLMEVGKRKKPKTDLTGKKMAMSTKIAE